MKQSLKIIQYSIKSLSVLKNLTKSITNKYKNPIVNGTEEVCL